MRNYSKQQRKKRILLMTSQSPSQLDASQQPPEVEDSIPVEEETSLTTDNLAFSNRYYGFGANDLEEGQGEASGGVDHDDVLI